MGDKYLPVGSVCMLKGGQKAVMIVGYGIQPDNDPNVMYDYLGALYPEGIITLEQNMVFNHENIEKILFTGYETDEQKEFNQKITEVINKMKSSGNIKTGVVEPAKPEGGESTQAPANDFNEQKIIPVDNPVEALDNTSNQASVETLGGSQENTAYVPPFASFNDSDNNM